MKIKTALVLGAGGFIGSHLVRKLKEDNAFAWGVIGFRKEYGETLFNSYNLTSPPLPLSNPGYLFIENFRDISRKYI
jgi:nucleoside-diphosphate-sugar epimerase